MVALLVLVPFAFSHVPSNFEYGILEVPWNLVRQKQNVRYLNTPAGTEMLAAVEESYGAGCL